VASIDLELLENHFDMERSMRIRSVCTDESVMEYLEYKQNIDASVATEFVKAEVLAKVSFYNVTEGSCGARHVVSC
jgi:hypothetical protein